jgi:uroporphyrinogen-III synthase
VAAIGPVTARALADEGLPARVVASSASAAALVEELARALAERTDGAE